MAITYFEASSQLLLTSGRMFATVTLMTLVSSVSGTPYISGGDSPRGTDCSGLVSWVTNAATGRPIYGDRFNTGNIERALLARGFKYGSQPGALNVGWNGGHSSPSHSRVGPWDLGICCLDPLQTHSRAQCDGWSENRHHSLTGMAAHNTLTTGNSLERRHGYIRPAFLFRTRIAGGTDDSDGT